MRAEWAETDAFSLLLTALMPENELALRVSMATGLRISDVLALKTEQLQKAVKSNFRISVKEHKTNKIKRVYVPKALAFAMLKISGHIYIFEHRTDYTKHRTRQAVFKDLRRVAKLYRIGGELVKQHISPHSARKIYAVDLMHKTGSVEKVQQALNHSDPQVTLLYALADELTKKRGEKRGEKMSKPESSEVEN